MKKVNKSDNTKIWIYQSKGGSKKYFKSESALLTFMGDSTYLRGKVLIYELKEEYDDPKQYRQAIISSRDRKEQLQVILENDTVVPVIQKIIEKISETKWGYKQFCLSKFKNCGKNLETFKALVSDRTIRIGLLSDISTDVEWYELLLSIHNFRFNPLDFKKCYGEKKETITNNFKTAKENVEKKKKIK